MTEFFCCTHCFNDINLQKFIESISEGKITGECYFCKSTQKTCIEPSLLIEKFEFLVNSFDEDDNGQHLSTLLNNYFAIFNENINQIEFLLEKILGETYQDKKYKFKFDNLYYTTQWAQFKDEIKYENRFFPLNSMYSSVFDKNNKESIFFELLEQLTKKFDNTTLFYRARVSETELEKKIWEHHPKEHLQPVELIL